MRKINEQQIYLDELQEVTNNNASNLTGSKWQRPSTIEQRGEYLAWKDNNLELEVVHIDKSNPVKLFNEFVDLSELKDELLANAVLRFARSYGVLGLCKHGTPKTHSKSPGRIWGVTNFCKILLIEDDWILEPLNKWRYYSQLIGAIISVANSIDKDTVTNTTIKSLAFLADKSEEEIITYPSFAGGKPVNFSKNEKIRLKSYFELNLAINNLLEITNVRPQFWWDDNERGFKLVSQKPGFNILSIITMQLVFLLNKSSAITKCANCGRLFALRKYQSISKKSYCEPCNPKDKPRAAWNAASKKSYQLNKKDPNRERENREKISESEIPVLRNSWMKWLEEHKPRMEFYKIFAEQYKVDESTIRKIVTGKLRTNIK